MFSVAVLSAIHQQLCSSTTAHRQHSPDQMASRYDIFLDHPTRASFVAARPRGDLLWKDVAQCYARYKADQLKRHKKIVSDDEAYAHVRDVQLAKVRGGAQSRTGSSEREQSQPPHRSPSPSPQPDAAPLSDKDERKEQRRQLCGADTDNIDEKGDQRRPRNGPSSSTSSRQPLSHDAVVRDVLQSVLPKLMEAQQSLMEPLHRLIAPLVDEEVALSFGCRSCEQLKRQLRDATHRRLEEVASYDASRLRSTPRHLQDLIPGIAEVWIDPDGQCALRAVAVGVNPSLATGDDNERVADVRRDLLGELRRWSVGKWMNVVPSYGVRALVVDDLGDDDRRTSYDIYLRYLSESMHQRTHLDHAIF
jgi:hypothetical protein